MCLLDDSKGNSNNPKKIRKDLIRFFANVLVLALLIFLTFTVFFKVDIAKGTDMFPSIKDGDVLLSYRLEKKYVKGDVVIYQAEDQLRCGRIVAIGGDTVKIKINGEFSVNNTVQSEEIVFPTYPLNDEEVSFQLDANTYYILGDYRTESTDSRILGSISEDNIQSKVISIFRRRGI